MNDLSKIEIIKNPDKEKPFIIVWKPSGLPTAPLSAEDKNNLLYHVGLKFPEIYEVKGRKEIEHGLLHRLDTLTSGLVIIAANQSEYERLANLQKENKIIKFYKAECEFIKNNPIELEGFPPLITQSGLKKGDSFLIKSYFRPYGKDNKAVRPVTEASGKAALKKTGKKVEYETSITILNNSYGKISAECKIYNGFRHQIRSHLAWLGIPLTGDPLYNSRCINGFGEENNKAGKSFEFSAYKIDIDGEIYTRKET